MVGDQPEQRRHEAGTDISACHLYADNGLRAFCTEVVRCGVDDARIHRRASQPDHDQTCKGDDVRTGQKHDNNAGCNDRLSQTDHLYII